jgi:ABC-type cobalamin/Fe3+-siderophores transport system ATPase subunit
MLKFTDLTVRRGPRVLFAGASFSPFRGEKIGIAGENGSGKSTLLELVRGVVHRDTGKFEMPGNLVMAHVQQDIEATDQRAKAQAALDAPQKAVAVGIFVDCYRFRGDVLDLRGDWADPLKKAWGDVLMKQNQPKEALKYAPN